MPELYLDLHTLSGVVVVDVLDLVTQNEGELVFAGHAIEHALADKDMAAGKGECVDEIAVGDEMKAIRQAAFGMRGYPVADLADVLLGGALFGIPQRQRRDVLGGEGIANAYLVCVGNASEVHGSARKVALPVCSDIDDGVGADLVCALSVLGEVKCCATEEQQRREREEALHSKRLTVSRYLP